MIGRKCAGNNQVLIAELSETQRGGRIGGVDRLNISKAANNRRHINGIDDTGCQSFQLEEDRSRSRAAGIRLNNDGFVAQIGLESSGLIELLKNKSRSSNTDYA